MAANPLPDSQSKLWSLASDMSDGFTDHDPGILQNTQAKLDTELQTAKDTEDAFVKAGKAEDAALTTRNIANSNGKAALALTKRQLTDVPGALALIWPAGTTEIPSTIVGRINLLEKAANYLRDNPAQAVPTKNFTELFLRAAYTSLSTGKSALNSAVTARVNAKTARETADKALRKRMSGLIGELADPGMLTPDDDRWYGFGLVPPAGVVRPGIAPDDVLLVQIAPGIVRGAWSATPRAAKYRPFYQVMGRDPSYIELPMETPTSTSCWKTSPSPAPSGSTSRPKTPPAIAPKAKWRRSHLHRPAVIMAYTADDKLQSEVEKLKLEIRSLKSFAVRYFAVVIAAAGCGTAFFQYQKSGIEAKKAKFDLEEQQNKFKLEQGKLETALTRKAEAEEKAVAAELKIAAAETKLGQLNAQAAAIQQTSSQNIAKVAAEIPAANVNARTQLTSLENTLKQQTNDIKEDVAIAKADLVHDGTQARVFIFVTDEAQREKTRQLLTKYPTDVFKVANVIKNSGRRSSVTQVRYFRHPQDRAEAERILKFLQEKLRIIPSRVSYVDDPASVGEGRKFQIWLTPDALANLNTPQPFVTPP